MHWSGRYDTSYPDGCSCQQRLPGRNAGELSAVISAAPCQEQLRLQLIHGHSDDCHFCILDLTNAGPAGNLKHAIHDVVNAMHLPTPEVPP